MATKEKTLEDLFLDTLKDIYHAEKQILRALGKMSKSAESDELRQLFEQHREETDGQIQRLEQVFEMLGKRPQGKPCEAMQGLVEEGKEIMDEFKGSPALDAGLISSAQAVEHYEMARYGTLASWATQLGMPDAARLFEETLKEEKNADQLLNRAAQAKVNKKAA
ncbi:ferritin-like domain-containing protein [Hansschlegelia beijingensis]|uniref:Ferritin-like metal-binding protein YciE n=1 Tax=Hansschlegelia beijingensis TaxID=1133344 RepID=A0A7W6D112_9HYPH|nr:ferritin-like domain-containing protein [Hansschlegelia beijingensis]MBB3972671.1 ferritin-like metal-binding protein YciE [Hansschlegelia beijingensis]